MPSLRTRLRLPALSLQHKLQVLIAAIICLILLGQTLFWLSSEVTDLDHRISAQGTIQAQAIAGSCATLLDRSEPGRFDPLLDRVARSLDLVDVTVTDRQGRVLASRRAAGQEVLRPHTESALKGFGVFQAPRDQPGLGGLFGGKVVYTASAPIVRGTAVIGHVGLRFRSSEIADKSTRLVSVAMAMAAFWLAMGGVLGGLYVRRITRPLATLTQAAQTLTAGRLQDVRLPEPTTDDEIGVLEGSFSHLVAALRVQMAENERLLESQRQLNGRLRQRVDEVTADLRETVTYLHAVIRALQEGLVTCDAHGEVVEANPASARQLAGFSRPVAGLDVATLVPDGQVLKEAVLAVVQTGKPQLLELTRPLVGVAQGGEVGPGGRRTLVFQVSPVLGAQARPVGAVLHVRDETAQRLDAVRLRRHDRLISLGTIAAGLAHELGNYLHGIHGFASLLLRDTPPDDPRRQDVTAIRDQNQRAVDLLERFLQFARPGQVRFRPEPVDGLVGEAVAMCAYRLRTADVTVETRFEPGLDLVRCDGRLLVQALINLLLNAVDALQGRPLRVVSVSARRLDSARLGLTVADTGTGIAPEHLERVFDPFFTTKEATGTGLGLSIAHQIVEAHGGSLTVDSAEGAGAVFTLELPFEGPKDSRPGVGPGGWTRVAREPGSAGAG